MTAFYRVELSSTLAQAAPQTPTHTKNQKQQLRYAMGLSGTSLCANRNAD